VDAPITHERAIARSPNSQSLLFSSRHQHVGRQLWRGKITLNACLMDRDVISAFVTNVPCRRIPGHAIILDCCDANSAAELGHSRRFERAPATSALAPETGHIAASRRRVERAKVRSINKASENSLWWVPSVRFYPLGMSHRPRFARQLLIVFKLIKDRLLLCAA
jgi:hypothetical protein